MDKKFSILVADRNPNVREFLKRELMDEGYQVLLANSCTEVLKRVYQYEPLDLVILDLDLPDSGDLAILEKLENRIPELPVIIHAFPSDFCELPAVINAAGFVEKKANSIELLKKLVYETLRRPNTTGSNDT